MESWRQTERGSPISDGKGSTTCQALPEPPCHSQAMAYSSVIRAPQGRLVRPILDWRGREVSVAESKKGGVIAFADYADGLMQAPVRNWPPPEILQKLYKSRQARAFSESDLSQLSAKLGYYCDLQSANSEDAATWSVFGPVVYGPRETRHRFLRALLESAGIDADENADPSLWLWRRVPHPEMLVPGGPEVDFAIRCGSVLVVGESKWLSGVAANQGARGDRDQIELRIQYLQERACTMGDGIERGAVLGLSWSSDLIKTHHLEAAHPVTQLLDVSWDSVARLPWHPSGSELLDYLQWKRALSGGA